jgi:hypothetical protein
MAIMVDNGSKQISRGMELEPYPSGVNPELASPPLGSPVQAAFQNILPRACRRIVHRHVQPHSARRVSERSSVLVVGRCLRKSGGLGVKTSTKSDFTARSGNFAPMMLGVLWSPARINDLVHTPNQPSPDRTAHRALIVLHRHPASSGCHHASRFRYQRRVWRSPSSKLFAGA